MKSIQTKFVLLNIKNKANDLITAFKILKKKEEEEEEDPLDSPHNSNHPICRFFVARIYFEVVYCRCYLLSDFNERF